jgi:hypothetical protein
MMLGALGQTQMPQATGGGCPPPNAEAPLGYTNSPIAGCQPILPAGTPATNPAGMPTTMYTSCSPPSSWSQCSYGAVMGPNGQWGVCGPCGGGIGLGAGMQQIVILAGVGLIVLLLLLRGM